mgnify:CR=1 FL=1
MLIFPDQLAQGCHKFFGEGQIQKNKQRLGPHTRGDIFRCYPIKDGILDLNHIDSKFCIVHPYSW